MIFGNKSIIFGYERILPNNRSFSINIDQTGFPSLDIVDSEELQANTILSERGFHISGDYRFYLSKLNKYNAPRGVYLGPYYGYNSFDKGHSWTLNSETSGFSGNVNSELGLTINTVGVELGYQFVFWKRFSVDMILLGPGVGFYKWDLSLDTNLSAEDSKLFFDKLNAALEEKFPGYEGTLGEGDFQKKGAKSTTSLGYRYMIQIGVDGIILMRLTDVEKSTDYVQGNTYYGGWGYGGGYYGGYGGWGYGGAMYSTPGYYEENKTYYVETNIYDVKSNKLLWSGTTSTLNPTKINEALDEIILAVKTELTNKGLIVKEETKKK